MRMEARGGDAGAPDEYSGGADEGGTVSGLEIEESEVPSGGLTIEQQEPAQEPAIEVQQTEDYSDASIPSEEPAAEEPAAEDIVLESGIMSVAATVTTAAGSQDYGDFSAAWDAAAAAGTATITLRRDWLSDANGSMGTGSYFSGDGTILMDGEGSSITIVGDGHQIGRTGGQIAGACVICVFNGTLDIRNTVISGGNNSSDGGGILVLGGRLSLQDVILKDNHAQAGAGLCVNGGSASLNNVRFTGNSAATYGGAVYVDTKNASLALSGVIVAEGNNSGNPGDIFLGGTSLISLDGLASGSSFDIACTAFEGERVIGNAPADTAKYMISRMEGYEISARDGAVLFTPAASAEEKPAETDEASEEQSSGEQPAAETKQEDNTAEPAEEQTGTVTEQEAATADSTEGETAAEAEQNIEADAADEEQSETADEQYEGETEQTIETSEPSEEDFEAAEEQEIETDDSSEEQTDVEEEQPFEIDEPETVQANEDEELLAGDSEELSPEQEEALEEEDVSALSPDTTEAAALELIEEEDPETSAGSGLSLMENLPLAGASSIRIMDDGTTAEVVENGSVMQWNDGNGSRIAGINNASGVWSTGTSDDQQDGDAYIRVYTPWESSKYLGLIIGGNSDFRYSIDDRATDIMGDGRLDTREWKLTAEEVSSLAKYEKADKDRDFYIAMCPPAFSTILPVPTKYDIMWVAAPKVSNFVNGTISFNEKAIYLKGISDYDISTHSQMKASFTLDLSEMFNRSLPAHQNLVFYAAIVPQGKEPTGVWKGDWNASTGIGTFDIDYRVYENMQLVIYCADESAENKIQELAGGKLYKIDSWKIKTQPVPAFTKLRFEIDPLVHNGTLPLIARYVYGEYPTDSSQYDTAVGFDNLDISWSLNGYTLSPDTVVQEGNIYTGTVRIPGGTDYSFSDSTFAQIYINYLNSKGKRSSVLFKYDGKKRNIRLQRDGNDMLVMFDYNVPVTIDHVQINIDALYQGYYLPTGTDNVFGWSSNGNPAANKQWNDLPMSYRYGSAEWKDDIVVKDRVYRGEVWIPVDENNTYRFTPYTQVEIVQAFKEGETDQENHVLENVKVKATEHMEDGALKVTFEQSDKSPEKERETHSVSGKVLWVDDYNSRGLRPRYVSLTLYADGLKTNRTMEVGAYTNWEFTFDDVPVNDVYGNPSKYTVVQDTLENYTPQYESHPGEDPWLVVRNTLAVKETAVSGNIIWNDENDKLQNRPSSVVVRAVTKENGIPVVGASPVTVSEDTGWKYTLNIPGYDASGMILEQVGLPEMYSAQMKVNKDKTVTFTNTAKAEKDFKVKVVWKDGGEHYRPDKVTLTLKEADGTLPDESRDVETFESDAIFGILNVPTYYKGKALSYTLLEEGAKGYDVSYDNQATEEADFTVTNVLDEDGLADINVRVTWKDNNNQRGVRPGFVKVKLLQDGEEYREAVISAQEGWKYIFKDVPRFTGEKDFGTLVEYTYSVEEEGYGKILSTGAFKDYSKEYGYRTEGSEFDFTIINQAVPREEPKEYTVLWDDSDNNDGIRPESITVQLICSNEYLPVKEERTITAAEVLPEDPNAWNLRFEKAASIDFEGNPHEYHLNLVEEIEGYTWKQDGDTLVLRHIPETVNITVTQKWDDDNDRERCRPESSVLSLDAGNDLVLADFDAQLSENNGWTYSFTDMPKYNAGKEIEYTVKRKDALPKYEDSLSGNVADGFILTSKHDVEMVTILVKYSYTGLESRFEFFEQMHPSINLYSYNFIDGERHLLKLELKADDRDQEFELGKFPKYVNGRTVSYYVTADDTDVFKPSVEKANDSGKENLWNIEYTYDEIQKTTDVSFIVVWDDDEDSAGLRPDRVKVRLLRRQPSTPGMAEEDFEETDDTLIVTKGSDGTYRGVFEDVQRYNPSETDSYRAEYEFSVKQEWESSYYTTSVIRDSGYSDSQKDKNFVIKNTLSPLSGGFPVEVIWENDNEEVRPAYVEVSFQVNGEVSSLRTLNVAGDWSYDFKDELVSDQDAVYSVVQKPLENYMTSYERTREGFTIRNRYNPGTISLPVTVRWRDEEDADGLRPDYVRVYLVQNGVLTDTDIILSASTGFAGSFYNLSEYDEDGEKIAYSVMDPEVPTNYAYSITSNMAGGILMNYRHSPATTNVDTIVVWEDDENRDGKRPSTISVTLLANGKPGPVGDITNADWTYTFRNVRLNEKGKEIKYRVQAQDLSSLGYETQAEVTNTGSTVITCRRKSETVSVTVKKIWDDGDNTDWLRPQEIKVVILCNGNPLKPDLQGVTPDDWDAETVTLSDLNNWQYTYPALPRFEPGQEGVYAEYTAREVELESQVEQAYSAQSEGTVITNTHEPEKREIKGTVVWDGEDPVQAKRPEGVTLILLADGDEISALTVLSPEKMSQKSVPFSFGSFPVYRNGVPILYTITEETFADYTNAVTENSEHIFTVTNTWAPDMRSVAVTVDWEDQNDLEGLRPASVKVELKSGDSVIGSADITAENNWNNIFEAASSASDINVRCDVPEGYTSVIEGNEKSGFIINLCRETEVMEVPIKITWLDNNNQDGIRPKNGIAVQIERDGKTLGSRTIAGNQNYSQSANIVGIPVIGKNAGSGEDSEWQDAYSLKAREAEGYTVNITGNVTEGFQAVYRHDPEVVTWTVKKVWAVPSNAQLPNAVNITVTDKNSDFTTDVILTTENLKTDEAYITWQTTVDLEKYSTGSVGVEAEYEFNEKADDDKEYVVSKEVKDNTVTVTNRIKGKIPVHIVWDDATDQDGIRPDKVTLRLTVKGEQLAVKSVFASSAEFEDNWNDWTTTFTIDESKYNLEDLWLDEDNIDEGYNVGDKEERITRHITRSESGEVESIEFTVYNYHEPAKIVIPVEKVWDDEDNKDGMRPDKIDVILFKAEGEANDDTRPDEEHTIKKFSIIPDVNGVWKANVNADKYEAVKEGYRPTGERKLATYSVWEIEPTGYDSEVNGNAQAGFKISNVKTHATVQVKNEFEDEDNIDGIRPSSINVTLYVNGEEFGKASALKENDYTVVFKNVPLTVGGQKAVYTASAKIDGYATETKEDDTLTLVHKHTKAVASFSGVIHWDDKNNQDGDRPDEVTVRLAADGEIVQSITVKPDEDGNWKFAFDDRPVFKDGKAVSFVVKEDSVDEYTVKEEYPVTYNDNRDASVNITITNTADARAQYDIVKFGITAPTPGYNLWTTTDPEIEVIDSNGQNSTIKLGAASVVWSPDHDEAKKNTKYIAKVKIDGGYSWRFADTVAGNAKISELPAMTEREEKVTAVRADDGSITFVFEFQTEGALTVQNPEDLVYPHGVDRSFISLPTEVILTDENGNEYKGTPTWDETPLSGYDFRKAEKQEFTIKSTAIRLPNGVNSTEPLEAQFKVIVAAGDAVQPPMATPGSGSYSSAQNVTLLAMENDVDIMYRVVEGLTDIMPGAEYKKYDGNPIAITKNSMIIAKCVKNAGQPEEAESETAKFVYRITSGTHTVTVNKGMGGGEYAAGDTVRIVAADKGGISSLLDKGKNLGGTIASAMGYDNVGQFIEQVPSMDSSAGKFTGWKVIKPDGLQLETIGIDQIATFTMPDEDVEIEAMFENETAAPSEAKKIKRVDITMSRTPKPGRNKLLSKGFYIQTDHVSWAGIKGVAAMFPEAVGYLESVKLMPVVSKLGVVPIFNGLLDDSDWEGCFQFGRTYYAEFPLIAADGYVFDENVEVYVDGQLAERASGLIGVINNATGTYFGWQGYTAQYTWKMRQARVLDVPAQPELELPNGISWREIAQKLPAEVEIVAEEAGGMMEKAILDEKVKAKVRWETLEPASGTYDPTIRWEQRFSVKGYLTTTERGAYYDEADRDEVPVVEKYDENGWADSTKKIPVTININVLAAEKLAKPTASLEPGTYEGTQEVELLQEQGANIYYLMDGRDPSTDEYFRMVYGGKIKLPEVEGETVDYTITAYAKKFAYYDSSVAVFHYTITPSTRTVNVVKTWEDDENIAETRPDYITFNLYKNGDDPQKVLLSSSTEKEDGTWSVTLKNLPKYKTGKEIEYSLVEDTVEGYRKSVKTETDEETGAITFNVTNSSGQGNVIIRGVVNWEDNGDIDGCRPDSVTLHINNEYGEAATKVVRASDAWRFIITGLPKQKMGFPCVYTITQDDVPDYVTVVTEPEEENGLYNVTNSYEPATTALHVEKVWDDDDNFLGKRPESINVRLYRTWVEAEEEEPGSENTDEPGSGNAGGQTDESGSGNAGSQTDEAGSGNTGSQTDEAGSGNAGGQNDESGNTGDQTGEGGSGNAGDQTGEGGTDVPSGTDPEAGNTKVKEFREDTGLTLELSEANGWTADFPEQKLRLYGQNMFYVVEEDPVPEGYEASIESIQIDAAIITNHVLDETTDITGTITWEDKDNAYGLRPTHVVINLVADGEVFKTQEVYKNEEGEWTFTFEDVPVFRDKEQINYTIEEDEVPRYETEINGYDVINTFTTEKVSLKGQKMWMDNDDKDGIRPDKITITLMANGVGIDSRTVSAEDGWKWEFDDLDKYDPSGKAIQYEFVEEKVEGYEAAFDGYSIVNTHVSGSVQEKIAVEGEQIWVDLDDKDGLRPDSVIIYLYADGNRVDSREVYADVDGNWLFSFEDLDKYSPSGKEIVYSVGEDDIDEYETVTEGYDLISTHTPEAEEGRVNIVGKKIWVDDDNAEGMRPDSITINLLADGKTTETKTVSEDDDWSWMFEALPETLASGKKITYSVVEEEVEDYTSESSGYSIINTYTPPQTPVTDKVTMSGLVFWNDADNKDEIRPENVTVYLIADGSRVADSQVVSADENGDWTFSFADKDAYNPNGSKIEYSVSEDAVEGYETSVNGFTITNTHIPESDADKVSVAGIKIWDDGDDADQIRPERITIHLYANVIENEIDSREVSAEDGWSWMFEDLNKLDYEGQEITYFITEDEVEGYETVIEGYDVTNIHEPETPEDPDRITISGEKTWDDEDNKDESRPESITVYLIADRQMVESQEVTPDENGKWTYSFTGQPRYSAKGAKIDYTVSEKAVDGYETVIDGYNITNKRTAVTPTPIPEDELTPTPTPEDELTPTPVPEDELTPTPTPEDELTPTPVPEDELTPTPIPEDELTPTPVPEDEITPTPEGEITPTPEGEITPTPEGEITPTPEGEITPTPEGEITPTPEGEITPTPEGEITPTPEGEITPTPEGEITPTPEGEITPTPEGEITPTREGEITPTPEGEITPTPEGEITPTPEGEITPTPEGEITPTPEGEITPTPEGEITPTPEGEITPTPEGEITPTPEGEITPTPEGEITPTPEGEITPTPEGDITPTPEGEITPTPEGEITPTPEGEITPTPEGEITPTPEGEITPAPEGEITPTPEGEITPTPEEEITPTPEGEITPTPEGEITPTPEGEITPTPEGEVTPTPAEPEIISISGSKTWDDEDDKDGFRPEVITITLYRNGEKYARKQVREKDGWSWTFDDLEKTDEQGKEYEYTITEKKVEGYEATIDGYNVTNKHIPESEAEITPTPEGEITPTPEGEVTPTPEGEITPTPEGEVTPTPEGEVTPTPEGEITPTPEGEVTPTPEGEITPTPEGEITPTPEGEITPTPEGEVTPTPEGEITPTPEGEITPTPEGEITPTPEGEITPTPEGEITPTPEGEITPTPEGEITPTPEGEITPTPEGEITPTPEGEITPTPEGEITPTPEGEITPTPEGEITPTPEGEITPTPEGEITPTPEGEITPTPEGEITPTPEGEITPTPSEPEIISISGSKTWDDEDDKDGFRPDVITITLYRNGEKYARKQVREKDGWSWTFDELEKTDEQGKEYEYTITEKKVEGYEATIDGYNVTNKHIPESEAEITPTPEGEVTPTPEGEITPTPEGEITPTPEGEVTPTPEGEITPTPEGEITPTPEGEITPTPEGEITPTPEGEITPTPEGEITPAPEGEITPTPEGEITPTPEGEITPTPEGEITPTPEGEITPTPEGEITPTPEGEITPTPEGEITPTPEAEITPTPEGEITPTPEGEITPTPEGEITLTPEGEITPTPEGEITPTPEGEITPTPEGEITPTPEGEITPTPEGEITPTPEGEITPTPEGEITPTPEGEITPTPEGEITPTPEGEITPTPEGEITPTPEGEITPTPEGEITPTPEGEITPTPEGEITPTPSGEITPTPGADITPTPSVIEKINIAGGIAWDDQNNQDKIRPAVVTVNLLRNGEMVGGKQVRERDGWSYMFLGYDKTDEFGNPYEYTITENSIEGYVIEIDGYNINNRHTPEPDPEKITISGVKTWNDADDKDGIRPKSITIHLLADQKEIDSQTVEPDKDGNWKYSFRDLDAGTPGAKAISYTITEDEVEGYTTTINGYNITNTHVPEPDKPEEKINIAGGIAWDDRNDKDRIRPEVVTINLLRNGEKVAAKQVRERDGWSYLFEDKAKADENGNPYEYNITEESIEGYDIEIDGYNVNNRHVPEPDEPEIEKITISGTKTWNDEDDKDGIRPKSITVHLLADRKEIDSQTVTAGKDGSWKYSFEDLDAGIPGARPISYTITEDAVEGYTTIINGYDIVNMHSPEPEKPDDPTDSDLISIPGGIVWDDYNDEDGLRPEVVTVNLYRNGEKVGSKHVRAKDGWSFMFTDCEKTDDEGNLYEYTFTENSIDEYEIEIDGHIIINRHTPESGAKKITVSGVKTWNDENDKDGIRPESITVHLFADRVEIDSQTVKPDKDGIWKYSFKDLDAGVPGAKAISYTVTEDEVEGYTTTINGYNITNTHTPEPEEPEDPTDSELISIPGGIVWDDQNDKDGIRPDVVTINLYRNGEKVGSKHVREKDGWSWMFTGYEKYDDDGEPYEYTFTENDIEDYEIDVDGQIIVNKHTPAPETEKITISGVKTWNDADDKDGIRPESITIHLFADRVEIDSKTVKPDKKGSWKYSFKDLDAGIPGAKAISYTITEDEVEGYTTSISGYNITNTHVPEPDKPAEKVNIAGGIAWDDKNDEDGIRPDVVTIYLLRNGEKVGGKQVREKDGWSYLFEDYPKTDEEGNPYEYSIDEDSIEGYEIDIDGYNVNNRHTPESEEPDIKKITISGVKTWNDADDKDGIRPESIKIRLLADRREIDSQTVKPDKDGNWKYSFKDLDAGIPGARPISYTITEDAVEGYTTIINGYNITNTHTPKPDEQAEPELINIAGSIVWEDQNDKDGIRPGIVMISLYRNGEKLGGKPVREKDGWSFMFQDYEKTDPEGNLYEYTVTESRIEEYETVIDGYTITNKHTPEGEAEITPTPIPEGEITPTPSGEITPTPEGEITPTPEGEITPTPEGEITPTPEGEITPTPEGEITPTPSGEITPTPSGEITPTPEGEITPTPEGEITPTPEGEITPTPEGEITPTPEGEITPTPEGEITPTPEGEITPTPEGEITPTPSGEITPTPSGEITPTPSGEITPTPEGEITPTPSGEITPTPSGEITPTPEGEITPTPSGEITPTPSGEITPTPSGEITPTPSGEITPTPAGNITPAPAGEITPTPGGGSTTPIPAGPEKITISGGLTWDDQNDKDGIRPEVITLNLYRNGEKVGSQFVRAIDNWNWSFEGYDKTDASGNAYKYTLTENKIEGYESIINGYSVTNRHTPEDVTPEPEKISISGVKTWNDADDMDGIRPDSITVKLFADGQLKETKTVKADQNGDWKYSFTDLDKSIPGRRDIVYTIEEEPVDGYETIVNGYNITNTHIPGSTPGEEEHEPKMYIQGEIFWVDDNNAEDTRPGSVDVTLYLAGQKIQTVNVTEGSDGRWLYEMQPVNRYATEKGIIEGAKDKAGETERTELQYSLRQEDVAGYKWTASLKTSEMDNKDVMAAADFTDTLKKDAPIEPSEEVVIPTPVPSNVSGGNNYSGGSVVHVGGTTVSNGSATTAGATNANASGTSVGSGSGSSTSGNGTSGSSAGTSAPQNRSTVSDGSQVSSVKTGDDSEPLKMLILLAASVLVILLYVGRRKVKQK